MSIKHYSWIQCDGVDNDSGAIRCTRDLYGASGIVGSLAREAGWYITDRMDLCPDHARIGFENVSSD